MYPGSYAMEFVGYAKESITPWLCYGISAVVVWQDLYQQTTAPVPRRTVLCRCVNSLSLTKHLWLCGHNNKYLLVIQSGSSFLGTPSIIMPTPILRRAVTGSWCPKTVQSNNNIVRSTTKNSDGFLGEAHCLNWWQSFWRGAPVYWKRRDFDFVWLPPLSISIISLVLRRSEQMDNGGNPTQPNSLLLQQIVHSVDRLKIGILG